MGVFSGKHHFLFIHIPKGGGNAVAKWISDRSVQATVVMEHRNDLGGIMDKHSNAVQWRSWMRATNRTWEDHLSFAIIREPVGRVQSVMTEVRRNRPWAQVAAGDDWWAEFEKVKTPDEFILSGLFHPDGPLHITHTQTWFVSDQGGVIVRRLIRLDKMSTEVPRILDIEGPIPVVHKGDYRPSALSREAELELCRLYYDDFGLYGELNG
jgi:hypothetical protein